MYWPTSYVVGSILGDSRCRILTPPGEPHIICIEDSHTGRTCRIVANLAASKYQVEVLHDTQWRAETVFQELTPAIYQVIRMLLQWSEAVDPQTTATRQWIPTLNGQRVQSMLRMEHQWTSRLHRSGWKYALEPLYSLHDPKGVLFDGFVEATFCWSDTGVVYDRPWVGVVHNPWDTPSWAGNGQSTNQHLLQNERFLESRRHCRGLFVLSEAHQAELQPMVQFPVSVLRLATEAPEQKFTWEKFCDNPDPQLVQVGHWLRNPNSLYQLKVHTLVKSRLDVGHSWEDDARLHLPDESLDVESVRVIARLNDAEYDALLSSNVVFLDLLGASANNAVVECILRHTPLLVNPLPAVVEHLGEDYPLYFNSLEEASAKAEDRELIRAAHEHLRALPKESFTQDAFLHRVITSEVYQSLAPKQSEPLILLAHARSGSTSLMEILGAHPDVRMVNEPFSPNRDRSGGCYHQQVSDQATLEATVQEIFHHYNGMKHLIYQLPLEWNHALVEQCGRRVLLYRQNMLAAVVSAMLAEQTSTWFGNREALLNEPLQPLDVVELGNRVRLENKLVEEQREFLNRRRLAYIEIAYEELFDAQLPVDERLARVLRLFNSLGYDPPTGESLNRIQNLLKPRYQINDQQTYERIPNIEEIEQTLGEEFGRLTLGTLVAG